MGWAFKASPFLRIPSRQQLREEATQETVHTDLPGQQGEIQPLEEAWQIGQIVTSNFTANFDAMFVLYLMTYLYFYLRWGYFERCCVKEEERFDFKEQ